MLNRRPYFFKYLYKDSKKEYNEYVAQQDFLCQKSFRKPLDKLLNQKEFSDAEYQFMKNYYKWCPLIISDSCMNTLCYYIESLDFDIKNRIKSTGNFSWYSKYRNNEVNYTITDRNKVVQALNEYKEIKSREESFINESTQTEDDKKYRESITFSDIVFQYLNNEDIITNILVDLFYEENPKANKDILWKEFGKVIFQNIAKNKKYTFNFPVCDEDGDIEYMGKKFKMERVNLLEQEN